MNDVKNDDPRCIEPFLIDRDMFKKTGVGRLSIGGYRQYAGHRDAQRGRQATWGSLAPATGVSAVPILIPATTQFC
jgi:hypothetical protein